jgi:hypothetical protein
METMNEMTLVLIIIAAYLKPKEQVAYLTVFLIPISAKCWEVFQHQIFTFNMHKAC